MSIYNKVVSFVFFLGAISASCEMCDAKKQYIYTVKVTLADHRHIRLTGFQVSDYPGIITSLHGVLGAIDITASSGDTTANLLTDLYVDMVDVANDVALLRISGTSRLPRGGLPSLRQSINPRQELVSCSHPDGNTAHHRDIMSNAVPVQPLSSFTAQKAREFEARRSPAPEIKVFALDANLVPGESGSPLFNLDGAVLGIVDGGIRQGAAQISWAIPYGYVNFVSKNNEDEKLRRIERLETTDLIFGVEVSNTTETNEISVSSSGDRQYSDLVKAVSIAKPGTTILLYPGTYETGSKYNKSDSLHMNRAMSILGMGNKDTILVRGEINVEGGADVHLENITLFGVVDVKGKVDINKIGIDAGDKEAAVHLSEGSIAQIDNSVITSNNDQHSTGITSADSFLRVEHTSITSEGVAFKFYNGKAIIDGCELSAGKWAIDAASTDVTLQNSNLRDVAGAGLYETHLFLLISGAFVHGLHNRLPPGIRQ